MTAEFKTHFEKVSKDRYELEHSTLMDAVKRMDSMKTHPVAIEENDKLNIVPITVEIETAIWEIRDGYGEGQHQDQVHQTSMSQGKGRSNNNSSDDVHRTGT